MENVVELRQLRYFVAVAEELHFGRAADRLHMSQSPLSRAIRDLERELGVTLFVRTTRRVELTPAGAGLLERARRALAEIDGAVADARRSGRPAEDGVTRFGCNPVGVAVAQRIAAAARGHELAPDVLLDEDTSPELLRRVASGELSAAVVLHPPSTGRTSVRLDALKDEPLLAALPSSHPYAAADAIPMAVFANECVLLPREPAGRAYIPWLRSAFHAAGYELERTVEMASAQWDRRLLPVAAGEAVGVVPASWADGAVGIVAVPFDPPVTMPLDLASRWPTTDDAQLLVDVACRLRDSEHWLTRRAARTELPRPPAD